MRRCIGLKEVDAGAVFAILPADERPLGLEAQFKPTTVPSAEFATADHPQQDYFAYGLRIRSPLALPFQTLHSTPTSKLGADVTIRIGPTPAGLPNPIWKAPQRESVPGAFLMTTVDNVARYLVTDGRDILVEPCGGSWPEIAAFLVDVPFAALLRQRGLTTLHASAVEAQGGAALFAGCSGAGKSSLAAALVRRGCALVSDDIAAVQADADGRFMAWPSSPAARMCGDVLQALGWRLGGLRMVPNGAGKYLVRMAPFRKAPLAVRVIYTLGARTRAAGVEIERVPFKQAVHGLLLHTYRRQLTQGSGRQDEHFRNVRALAAQVPVFHVVRSARSFELPALDALAERIAAHLQSCVDAPGRAPAPDSLDNGRRRPAPGPGRSGAAADGASRAGGAG